MKQITNKSLQGLELILKGPKGLISEWLAPNRSVVVPEVYLTNQVRNLGRRRILKIVNA